MKRLLNTFVVLLICTCMYAQSWVEYVGDKGAGKGKKVVLISGDEEYRSEEALPMLASILAYKHGFHCIVLFPIHPDSGEIDPAYQQNIPGLENLATADLMIIFTRFRELPDQQMKHIHEYLKKGKPVIGLRTSTHAFAYSRNLESPYAKYSHNSKVKNWESGFGTKILGETWVAHHGIHGKEGTRVLVNGIVQNKKHTILNGVKDIWTPSDVYTVRELDESCNILLYGQSTSGMSANSPVNLNKSIMPVAWTKTYSTGEGKSGIVFTTTMGSAVDFQNEDLRRLIINAAYWATGLEKQTPEKADVNFLYEYKPTFFGFNKFIKGTFPSNYIIK